MSRNGLLKDYGIYKERNHNKSFYTYTHGTNKIDSLPEEYQAMAYGLDFGFVNPVALVKVCLIDNNIYLDERIYKNHITNSELIEMLSHEERGDIYADRDELQRIEEISRAGHVIYSGEKDVKMGIDLCARHKLFITKRSVNGIKELRGYQRKTNKDGTVLEEPIKYNDHFCDAMRFGVYGLVSRFGFATSIPTAGSVIHSLKKEKVSSSVLHELGGNNASSS